MSRAAAALILLLGAAGVRAADDPKALIERARRVSGWEAAHERAGGEHVRARGTTSVPVGEKGEPIEIVFQYETHWDRRHRERVALTNVVAGEPVKSGTGFVSIVVRGGMSVRSRTKCWEVEQDSWKLAEDFQHEQVLLYQAGVTRLEGLLEDSAFRLAPLAETRIEGARAAGVRVSRKGQADVLLYFDRASGYLVKTVARWQEQGADKLGGKKKDQKEVVYETRFQDYGSVDFGTADEALLKNAGIAVAGSDLVALLRRRTLTPAVQARLKQRVRELGDDMYAVRERASKDLVALGPVARPLLREAARSSDREVARRARACLKRIKEPSDDAYLIAVVHLLALRQPRGAASTLLDYLPTASAPVAHEVRAALYHLGADSRHPDTALVAALKDNDPVRRAAAEAALGKDGGAYARRPGRRVYPRGIRHPRKIIEVFDGKSTTAMVILDLQYYNRFDDSLFGLCLKKGD